jgi:hypothetical protein
LGGFGQYSNGSVGDLAGPFAQTSVGFEGVLLVTSPERVRQMAELMESPVPMVVERARAHRVGLPAVGFMGLTISGRNQCSALVELS